MGITREQRDRMRDYVLQQLDGCGETVRAVRGSYVPGIDESNCILVGNEGIVLLVDQVYTEDGIKALYNRVKYPKPTEARSNPVPKARVNMLLYKDGDTFFRSSMAGRDSVGIVSKRRRESFDHYTEQEKNKLIGFRPEEKFAFALGESANLPSGQKMVQYYQPATPRCEEGIALYRFRRAVLDNTNNDNLPDWQRTVEGSKNTYLWLEEKKIQGPVKLGYRFLLPRA